MMRPANRRPLLRIFGIPILLGLSSALGLLSALLGDGVWDMVSWFALGLPLAVVLWFSLRARPQRMG